MSTRFDPDSLAALYSFADEITVPKSIIVSCTTFHFYYTALHFDEEVEYIWSKKWTAGKVMYLLTRYSGAFFLVSATIGVFGIGWNDVSLLSVHTHGFLENCLGQEIFTGLGTMVLLLAEVILEMRVHALYGMKKKGLIFFVVLTLALFTLSIFQATNLLNDAEGICLWGFGSCKAFLSSGSVDGFCGPALPMSGTGWVVTSSVELLLFLLVIGKTVQLRKDKNIMLLPHQTPSGFPQNRDITALMAKDSILYFAIIFTVCIVGTGLSFASDYIAIPAALEGLSLVYKIIAITSMTILAPKLLINLRAEYYGPVGIIQTQLSWNAEVARRSCAGLESFEGLGDVQTCSSEGYGQSERYEGRA